MQRYCKEFGRWAELKLKINDRKKPPSFQERQIWWASIGVNVGFELDGKNRYFDRPVIIIRKISRYSFIGIPLTTNTTYRPTRHLFTFRHKQQNAILDQIRLFDSRRLNNLMGKLNENDFAEIKSKIKAVLNL